MNRTRACILSVASEQLSHDEALFLDQANPWGVILMGRSVKTRDQVRALVDEIWAAMGRACLIFIDQEGGRVRRMRPPEWPDFPAAGLYAALYEKDPEMGQDACFLGHRLMAAELAPVGIHADCAPVLDLLHPGAHDIVGDRAFGTTPEAVTALGRAALDGLKAGGVAGVIKHLPGHGRAALDSHKALPVVTASDNEMSRDMAPFSNLADAPMAMTAHIAYSAFEPGVAATVSRRVVGDVIRRRIGFDGLLMTDDLGMNALGGTLASRAQRAFDAGCDIALHCSGFVSDPKQVLAEMREVAGASPFLTGKSRERAEAAEAATLNGTDHDKEADWARFNDLCAIGREALS